MDRLLDVLLTMCAAPVVAIAAYLFTLAALSRRSAAPCFGAPARRFDVIVPAHDEEAGIARTVASLLATDYPAALRRVVVVADNCTDRTAAVAERAGATVLVRTDPDRRGKGYALQYAFEHALAGGFADAVVVVDADTVASPALLRAFDQKLRAGAEAAQAKNSVLNAGASWRTRLMAIAFGLFNDVRSLARERLGVSTGLRGNGMCLSARVLREVPHDAFSVVEDLEYGIQLGEAGHRVHYAPHGEVLSQMVTSARASRSQRERWEGGRMQMMVRRAPGLLAKAVRRRDPVLLDLAVDLLVPPLAYVVLLAAAGLAASLAASLLAGAIATAVWAWSAAVVGIAVYVARGWWVSGTSLRGLADLACAPVYVLWKVGLLLRRRARAAVWVRTTREPTMEVSP